MQVIQGIHYKTGQPVELITADGLISEIKPLSASDAIELPYIAPGLIDLQVNGCFGFDLNSRSLTVNDVEDLTLALLAQGVTSYYPTVITNSDEHIIASLTTIARACRESAIVEACVQSIHLEGPFISPQDGPVGAHNKQYVRAPDWQLFSKFNEAAAGRIKIITLSPEWAGAAEFTAQCIHRGVKVSIGHTAANSAAIDEVVNAGARLSTHLGNGTHQVLPRHPNYIWDQLADDRLTACFIGDGFHLPDAVIKVILKVKGSHAVLVSDSVGLAGMEPGEYTTPVGGNVVLTKEGKLHLAGMPGTLAGSAQTLLQGINMLCRKGICNTAGAWDLGTVNAARVMGLPQLQGLQAGAPADVVLFYENNKTMHIAATYKNGKQVYAAKQPVHNPITNN